MGSINVGAVPGPKSKALLERRQKAVSRGLATMHPLFIHSATGATLTDVDGNTFIDFTGGIGAMNIGHARPELVEAATAQAKRFTHTAIQVTGYEAYIALAEKLCQVAPIKGDKRAFIVTTGTEACENAIKFARAKTGRAAVIAFEHGFHGRSLGGLSLTSKYKPYKAGFGPFLPEIYRLPYPTYYREGLSPEEATARAKARLTEFLRVDVAGDEVAAIILETVLGEGGFLAPPPGFLQHLREVCTQHGILLVIDEVQCGFARTGKLFAIEHFGVEPDLITMAKSMAGGFPVAAVVGKAEIMDCVEPGALGGTYAGNPMAAAAALAAIEVIEKDKIVERSAELGKKLQSRLKGLQEKHPLIGDVRGIGPMMAIELVKDRGTREPASEATSKLVATARERGLLLLPTGTYSNVIRMLMPLVITDAQLDEAFEVLEGALKVAASV
jgi:4-aminobutyrate aminotransferase/(S)-3-amino-2-methylpropionate transaminase